jgi:hypothetical protein
MRRASLALLLTAVSLGVVPPRAAAAADWTRLRSPNFILEGGVEGVVVAVEYLPKDK